jgi:hypothetical protein
MQKSLSYSFMSGDTGITAKDDDQEAGKPTETVPRRPGTLGTTELG